MKTGMFTLLLFASVLLCAKSQVSNLIIVNAGVDSTELKNSVILTNSLYLQLDPQNNPWDQMIEIIKANGSIQHLHILSKANSKNIIIGKKNYPVLCLEENLDLLNEIDKLSDLGLKSLSFYGSSIASREEGIKMLKSISDIAGVSVYASTNESKDNYTLEYSTDNTPHHALFDDSKLINWHEDLTLK